MEAPKPIVMETKVEPPKIIKEFDIELNEEIYTLKVGKFSNVENIYFIANQKNNSLLLFEGNYSLNALCKLNQSFRFFNSIDDLINVFDDMVKNKKIFMEKSQNDNLLLKLGIIMSNFMGKEDKILIDLKLNELPEKDGDKKLLAKIVELLLQKDENIKSLNKKYDELEKRIEKLESRTTTIIKSDIVSNDDIDFIKEKLSPNKKMFLELIYKCDESNDTPQIFHKQCDGRKNILVFIETTEGVKFGGYTSIGFNSNSGETKDNCAFIFSVDKKKIYHVKMNNYAIFCGSIYGPCFCGTLDFNIFIYGSNFLKGECHTSSAKDNKYDINSDYELNNGKYKFFIRQLEIFQINNY